MRGLGRSVDDQADVFAFFSKQPIGLVLIADVELRMAVARAQVGLEALLVPSR